MLRSRLVLQESILSGAHLVFVNNTQNKLCAQSKERPMWNISKLAQHSALLRLRASECAPLRMLCVEFGQILRNISYECADIFDQSRGFGWLVASLRVKLV